MPTTSNRKAIYGEIPVSRRSQWHMRVADRLQEMFAGNEANVAHEIAAHARASKAGRYSALNQL